MNGISTFKYMQLFSRCFCTYRLLYWLWQKLCSSDQTNLPLTSKTQGQNPTTDHRETDVVLHCGWVFFNLHLASLWGLRPHSTDTTTATHWPEVLKHLTRGSPKYPNTSPGDYKTLRLMSLEIWRYWSNREALILVLSCCYLVYKMMLSSMLTNHFTFLPLLYIHL